jgi:ribose 5-phosphate isomerase B
MQNVSVHTSRLGAVSGAEGPDEHPESNAAKASATATIRFTRQCYACCSHVPVGLLSQTSFGPKESFVRVAIGSDHAGFEMKRRLIKHLEDSGHMVTDVGTDSTEPVDYPDFAAAVAREVVHGQSERGIVVCGSGAGASIAANKITGARSAVVHDHYTAHQSVEHDDMNVLALGSRVIGETTATEIVDAYLAARFSNEERHARRLRKVVELDRNRG